MTQHDDRVIAKISQLVESVLSKYVNSDYTLTALELQRIVNSTIDEAFREAGAQRPAYLDVHVFKNPDGKAVIWRFVGRPSTSNNASAVLPNSELERAELICQAIGVPEPLIDSLAGEVVEAQNSDEKLNSLIAEHSALMARKIGYSLLKYPLRGTYVLRHKGKHLRRGVSFRRSPRTQVFRDYVADLVPKHGGV